MNTSTHLRLIDKLFPVIILSCMAIGLILGNSAPNLAQTLEPFIPIGLFLMIYPTVAKVPFDKLRKSALEKRPALLSIALNYFFNPLLLWLFGWIFLRNDPDLWTGLILLGIAPCIGMVLVWADLGKADNALSVSLMAWNSLIQIVSVPIWIFLLVGTRVPLPTTLIFESTFLYLLLPLIAAYITRWTFLTTKGEQWFKQRLNPILGNIQLFALLATLILMFALKSEAILKSSELIAYMILPLTFSFVTLFALGTWSSCFLAKLPIDKSVTVGFHVTGRNFELSIALALTAFADSPMVVVSTVIGPLIEVPVMLLLVWIARHIVERYTERCISKEQKTL
ncbi:MAG: arsenic resistance protein [Leptonema sp. (in: bacteria)]